MRIFDDDVDRWYVVFWHGKWSLREPWAIGGYRHVSAFAYVRSSQCWIHINPDREGLSIISEPDGPDANYMIAELISVGDVVAVSSEWEKSHLGLGPTTCVTIIKHLIGTKSGALTPAGLKKYLLRNGQEKMNAPRENGSPRRASAGDHSL